MSAIKWPEPTLRNMQYAFANHIRAPEIFAMPSDVAPERMAVYRELFFNNVQSFLADSFPVLRACLSDASWLALAQDFYARHVCETPLFTRLGEEFLDYLQNERETQVDDPPYLKELAHYEWVELVLALSPAEDLPAETVPQALTSCRLRLSPLALPLRYHFPVHLIGPGFDLDSVGEGPFHLLAYRDREERVRFMEIDAFGYALLSVLQTLGEVQADELLRSLGQAAMGEVTEGFMNEGMQACTRFMQAGVIGPVEAAVPEEER